MACGTYKYQESYSQELPGCDIYSIRQRPKNFPKTDINYSSWPIVMWNIEKKSPRCDLTATGSTREEAFNAMKEMLKNANNSRIDTYNGIPGSGLGNHTLTPDQIIKEYIISPESFTNISIEYGPWKTKNKNNKKNNNCGRNDAHQRMRKVRFMIEYEVVERGVKEK